jgi:hypothetical protein
MRTCTLHEYKLLKYLFRLWDTIRYNLLRNKVIYKKILIISQIKFIKFNCDSNPQNKECRIPGWGGICNKCNWYKYNNYCKCTIVF